MQRPLFSSGSRHFIETSLIGTNGIGGDISISLWTKTFSDANEVLLEINGNNGFSVQTQSGFYQLNTGGRELSKCTKSNSKPYSDSNWHHVVLISKNGKGKISIDGIWDTQSTTLKGVQFYNGEKLIIGSRKGNVGYNGTIDEVRIYNRALSDTEIKALYNANK